nr:Chain A, ALA-ALA-ASP-THR-TRP-GLU [Homo sapiens]6C3T_B Chain B, ALA-ALA-ASP-THR-TRP-GLU [Homo sapiens]
AADTWE